MNHSELSVETEKHLAQLTETSRMSTRKWVLRTMTCGPSVRSRTFRFLKEFPSGIEDCWGNLSAHDMYLILVVDVQSVCALDSPSQGECSSVRKHHLSLMSELLGDENHFQPVSCQQNRWFVSKNSWKIVVFKGWLSHLLHRWALLHIVWTAIARAIQWCANIPSDLKNAKKYFFKLSPKVKSLLTTGQKSCEHFGQVLTRNTSIS